MIWRSFLAALSLCAASSWAVAGALDGVNSAEATQALRDSLTQAAQAALGRLGRKDGYFANAQVKIGLPRNFRKAERILRLLGQGQQVDDLVLAMNRAAEMAAPAAERLVLSAVKQMEVQDGRPILSASDHAATDYFRKATESRLAGRLLPAIREVAEPSGLTRAYEALAATLVRLAGIKSEQATVEDYVSKKALAGIYAMMAIEEHALRGNAAHHADNVAGEVFSLIH